MRWAFSESMPALASLAEDRGGAWEQATPNTKSGSIVAPMDVLIVELGGLADWIANAEKASDVMLRACANGSKSLYGRQDR